ncbi:MAG: DUF1015 domain-containing protein [Aureliella sp.]
MPKIQAFRGLRYNLAQVGSLSEVIAPPYDVIDPPLHEKLLASSPYNIVRLELPVSQAESERLHSDQTQDDDQEQKSAYHRAASLFRQWIRDGVLQHEPDPAIYVYHQSFDHDGRTYTRRGFMSRILLERFGEGKIYPHEETHSSAKTDRLRLTRACQANMSQIFGLYPDPMNAIQNLLEARISNQAALETVDHLGVTHRVWPIVDQDLIGEVAAQLEDKPLFIADGHHRYETACNYRDELAGDGELPVGHPAHHVLGLVMSMDDPGLLVMPTHRLFAASADVPIDFSADDLSSKLAVCFECEPAGTGCDDADAVWQQICEIDDQGVIGLYTAKDDRWTLVSVTEETSKRMSQIAPEHSPQWRSLGVSILHRLIVDKLLGLEGHAKPTYVHEVAEVKSAISSDQRPPLAALVMPASVDDIRQISQNSERMPAKSTYFFPKLLSGLVINPLDCS